MNGFYEKHLGRVLTINGHVNWLVVLGNMVVKIIAPIVAGEVRVKAIRKIPIRLHMSLLMWAMVVIL